MRVFVVRVQRDWRYSPEAQMVRLAERLRGLAEADADDGQGGEPAPGRIAKWLGRYCVYRFPGCTCRLSPRYMAFYRSLVRANTDDEADG